MLGCWAPCFIQQIKVSFCELLCIFEVKDEFKHFDFFILGWDLYTIPLGLAFKNCLNTSKMWTFIFIFNKITIKIHTHF